MKKILLTVSLIALGAGIGTIAISQDFIGLITTDRLLGRDTAGTGQVEELTVGGGVEFTGSGGIQRSALTGDVAATAGSGATDIDEAAVEAEIEPTLDTLANLTSIQGQTVTLADAGANAFFGWDDVAGAYENLTSAEAEAIVEPLIDTLANLTSVQGFPILLTDDNLDVLFGWDDSDGQYESLALAEIATEATPAAGDFVVLYGAEGDLRKVNWSSLPGVGGGISNVVEDLTPQLGGALDTNGFAIELGAAATDTSLVRSGAGDATIEGNVIYRAGGTDVPLGDGGTGASLSDPAGNRLLAWDDTANAVEFQDAGTGLTAGTTTLDCDTPTESAVGCMAFASTAEAEAGTDTTQAVTAAGVLAAVTGKKPIWIPAGALIPRSTAGCAINDLVLTVAMTRTCDFDTTTEEGAGFWIRMPSTWDEGTVTAVFVWTHAAATTFGVVWQVGCVAVSNDDLLTASLGTQQEIADTGGTTSDQYTTSATPAVTCAGTPQADDMVYFEFEREPGNGSDTLDVDAKLLGVTVYYTDNAFVEP